MLNSVYFRSFNKQYVLYVGIVGIHVVCWWNAAVCGNWQVGQLVAAMKMGRIKPRAEKQKDEEPKFYDLWANSEQVDWILMFRYCDFDAL